MMESKPFRIAWGLLAICLACGAPCRAAVEVAGKLLVDLDAADFAFGSGKWPQRSADTGIPGDFIPKGSPTRQSVGGAPAVVFDGDGDYFVGPFTTAALHAPQAKHSVEVWVYQGNVRDQETVVSWGKRWGRPDLSLAAFRYGADPELGAIARWGSSESAFAKVPEPGRWHHIAYTFDGTEQAVYVDGALDNAKQVGLLDAHDMLPIHLGAEICGDLKLEGQFTQYSGALARVRIHSGALSAAQVKRNHEAERPGFPGLTAVPLRQAPMHRFSFNLPQGPAPDGTRVGDSIGGLAAVIRGGNAEFTGRAVRLPGGSPATEAYLDFPNGLISSRENVTIEFWETQLAVQDWCRILSIGTNSAGEIHGPGGVFSGTETLTLFGNVGALQINRFARSYGKPPNGGPDRDPSAYPDSELGVEFHQVVTYDKRLAEWHWYRNGLLMEVIPDLDGSATLDDVNVWLGRSEFGSDRNFHGLISEVRVYNHALDEGEIFGNFLAGPERLELGRKSPALSWTPVEPGTHAFAGDATRHPWNGGKSGMYPDGPGSTATFASALTGDQEILLDSLITLGSINLGSPAAKGAFTLRADKDGAIMLDSGNSGSASVTQPAGSPANRIVAPVTVISDAEITNLSSSALTLGGSIHGRGNLIKTGSGPVVITGDGGSYNGQFRVVAGDLVWSGESRVKLPMVSLTTIQENGRLVIDRADDVSLDGEFTGPGRFVHRGKGALLLTESGFLTTTGGFFHENGAGRFTSEGLIEGVAEFRSDGDTILRGRGVTRLGGALSVGDGDGGWLTIRDHAEVEVGGAGHVNIGDRGSGQSLLMLKGGKLRCREMFVGKNAGLGGVVLQSGGDVIKEGNGDTRVGGGVPGTHEAWGAWHMKGGTLTDAWNLQIGTHGIGVMEIDGGEIRTHGFIAIGRYQDDAGNPSYGLLDVKSGSVTSARTDNYILVGEEGIGVLNIRGKGTVTCVNKLMIGAGSIDKPGDGAVNLLAGGTLVTSGIEQMNASEAAGRLYFDGGTLRAGASNSAFLEGLDAVFLGASGVRVDTNGFDIAINQDLLDVSGKGISRIPVAGGGLHYLGAPLLAIRGGGGKGACAVAELDNGVIRAVVITNPGVGYSSAPEVAVLGGGAGNGLKLGTPELVANAGGGLIKTGAGTLTLGGVNSYPGTTTVEQGCLRLSGGLAGPVAVAAGASLTGGGVIGGSVEVAPGAVLSPCAGSTLKVRGDVEIQGTFLVDAGSGGAAGRLDATGRLDLGGARLGVKAGAPHLTGAAVVIASYGSLQGRFTVDEPLPAGYSIDYDFNGNKQIALVPANAD